jgi:hypothetical protein
LILCESSTNVLVLRQKICSVLMVFWTSICFNSIIIVVVKFSEPDQNNYLFALPDNCGWEHGQRKGLLQEHIDGISSPVLT